MPDPIRLDHDGAVGVVTLAKPPHNLIDATFLEALCSAFERGVNEGCRVLLLRSDMRHFCAGADVGGFSSDGGEIDGMALLDRLEGVPVPTLAAVGGAALGGGFEIALACDLIVAAENAELGLVETSLGLLPLLGGVQRVTQRAGTARGKEIAFFGRRHDAATLERWGVINLAVAETELDTASRSWARQLAAGPTVAYGGVKALANTCAREGLAAADARQASVNDAMWASEDVRRGLEAFRTTGPGSAEFIGK